MRSTAIIIAPLISGALLSTPLHAQFGRGVGDFSTTGADAQRSSWVRNDAKISRESMQKPGFQFLWKVKLANEARQLNALTPASLLTGYIGYRGFRSLGYVGGSADKVFALDTDLGRVEWQKGLTSAPGQQGPSATCPGGMSAMIVRPVSAAFPVAGAAGVARISAGCRTTSTRFRATACSIPCTSPMAKSLSRPSSSFRPMQTHRG